MRTFQIALLVLGLLALLTAIGFVGSVTGDALWRGGVATLLLDIVCILLWPKSSKAPTLPSDSR